VLHVRDAVDFHENVYVREIAVQNGSSQPRDLRLFFHQDFHLYGSEVGDTALYDPRLGAVLHYKGRRYLLANVATPARAGVEDWAIGVKEFQGAEGTWRDAEDGLLARNTIAQGSVDSTIGLRVQVPAGGRVVCHYWLAAGYPVQRRQDDQQRGARQDARHSHHPHARLLDAVGEQEPDGLRGSPRPGRLALQAQSAHHQRPDGQPRGHPRRERLGFASVRA
jgi:GH15 family glucan-1,4-alpha-glucosidase